MIKRISLAIAVLVGLASLGAAPAFARSPRVVDDNDTVVMHRNVHPLARPEFDVGATSRSLPMERMVRSGARGYRRGYPLVEIARFYR